MTTKSKPSPDGMTTPRVAAALGITEPAVWARARVRSLEPKRISHVALWSAEQIRAMREPYVAEVRPGYLDTGAAARALGVAKSTVRFRAKSLGICGDDWRGKMWWTKDQVQAMRQA